MSRLSMQSAPAHIPATRVASFGEGLADPDLIRGSAIRILPANNCDSPVWAASVITGTKPAHDTRCSSSNSADAAMKLCDTFTGSAFRSCADKCVRNTHHHSSEGTFLISTLTRPSNSSVDRGLVGPPWRPQTPEESREGTRPLKDRTAARDWNLSNDQNLWMSLGEAA